jgi:hypothetical protein
LTAQRAAQEAPALLPLLRDLNVFVAAFAAIVSLAGFAVFVPLSLVLKLALPSRQAELLAWPLGYVLVAAFLCWRWWKRRLSPRQVDPARQMRFRVGHLLLAVFNVAMVTMFGSSWLVASSVLPPNPAVAGMFMGLVSLAPLGLVGGLVMVLSARETAPAFADTTPAAADAVRNVPSAKWPVKPAAPAGKSPSVIVVFAGLVLSSLVTYVAGMLGAAAVHRRGDYFVNTVLPIMVGVFAIYVITTVVLMVMRKRAANWVAWAPVTFLLLIVPAVQAFGVLFREFLK